MTRWLCWAALCAAALLVTGCGNKPTQRVGLAQGASDVEQVRAADVSILFIGNSHTGSHDLPNVVAAMIRFRHPDKKVYGHQMSVGFLEEVAHNPAFRDEIESRPWKYVVLQAQKISVSGKHDYSRTEAIDFAQRARERGATVIFYPEWGLKGKPGDGARQEKVYREMAKEAGVGVAPVASAWDLALAAQPELPLHAEDGNHQSALGAFLTACVLYGQITGDDPATLAAFPYAGATDPERAFLADVAARAQSANEK